MEKNLLHRMILLLLTTSTIYNLYKSFTHYNNDSHKNINSLTVTLGSKLNLSFNNRIGYSPPQRAKNCVKTRNLILIFLAMQEMYIQTQGLKRLIAVADIPPRAAVGLPGTKSHPCLTGYQTFHKVQDDHCCTLKTFSENLSKQNYIVTFSKSIRIMA